MGGAEAMIGDKQWCLSGTKIYVRFKLQQGLQLRADGDSIASPVWNVELAAAVEHEAR